MLDQTQETLPGHALNRLQTALLCSGAGALLLEAIWFRQLGWALGNTVLAGAATLAAFMLGLALGATLCVWLTHRIRHPARGFVLAETLVAVSGALVILLLSVGETTLAGWLQPLLDRHLLLQSLRFWLSVGLLLLPALAMGVGLPLLTCVWGDAPRLGPLLGRLYAANTLGGVLGLVLGECLLIPLLGLPISAAVALLLILASAALVWPLRDLRYEPPRQPVALAPWTLLLMAAGIGAAMLAIEVVGFRLISLQTAGTTRTLALAVACVLAGLALGSRGAALWTERDPRSTNAISLLAVAAAAAWLSGIGLASLGAHLEHPMARWGLALPGLFLPASLCSGALLTLIAERLRQVNLYNGPATAQLLAANAAGAALGAGLAGSWLLPAQGPANAAIFLALGLVVLALVAALARRSKLQLVTPVLGLAVAAMGIRSIPALVDGQVAAAARPYQTLDDSQRVAIEHGRNETLQLLRSDFLGEPNTWRLVTNRYSMSSTARDSERYMSLFAWWSLALQSQPVDSLLISYGLGTTAKALLSDQRLGRVDIVDISPESFSLASQIHNLDPLDDARAQRHVTDGRFYLAAVEAQYDVITGEPPPPRMASVVNLYTRDYFQQMRQRLAPEGVATYWLPVDQLSPASAKAITAAFCDAFEHCFLAAGSHYNWILIAAPAKPAFNDALWDQRSSLYQLRRTGVESPAMLWTGFLADAQQLRDWVGDTPALTDHHPGRLRLRNPDAEELLAYANWASPSEARRRFFASAWVANTLSAEQIQAVAELWDWQPILNGFIHDAPIALIDGLLDTDLITPVLWGLGSGWNEQRIAAMDTLTPDGNAARGQQAFHQGVGSLARREPRKAKMHFLDALDFDVERSRELAVYAACRAGQRDEAERIAGPARFAFRCW